MGSGLVLADVLVAYEPTRDGPRPVPGHSILLWRCGRGPAAVRTQESTDNLAVEILRRRP
jgi:hypothetical protein